jgi:hypothetical protein
MFIRYERGHSPLGSPVFIADYRIDLREPAESGRPWATRHCRRPLHNAFFQWHAANQDKFAIRLKMLRHAGRCIDLGFCGINRILTAHLVDDGITKPRRTTRAFAV